MALFLFFFLIYVFLLQVLSYRIDKEISKGLEVDLARCSEGVWLILILFSGPLETSVHRFPEYKVSHSIPINSNPDQVRNKYLFFFQVL